MSEALSTVGGVSNDTSNSQGELRADNSVVIIAVLAEHGMELVVSGRTKRHLSSVLALKSSSCPRRCVMRPKSSRIGDTCDESG